LCLTRSHLEDFEVSIFLTEIRTRHSLLVKNKTFKDKSPSMTGNGGKLTRVDRAPVTIQDESDDEHDRLAKIPEAVDLDDQDLDDDGADTDLAGRDDDGKKKLGFKTTYEGFSIWGWVLCLFIERKGGPGKKAAAPEGHAQALMQDWIESTQQRKDDDG
jgi:hypothetical protein